MYYCQDVQTDMYEQWPHGWDALRAEPKPNEITNRDAGRARLWGLHFFVAANASHMDRTERPGWRRVAWALWRCIQESGSTLWDHWASEEQFENIWGDEQNADFGDKHGFKF